MDFDCSKKLGNHLFRKYWFIDVTDIQFSSATEHDYQFHQYNHISKLFLTGVRKKILQKTFRLIYNLESTFPISQNEHLKHYKCFAFLLPHYLHCRKFCWVKIFQLSFVINERFFSCYE